MLTLLPSKSRVLIETEAGGLLASLAHDLRIVAPPSEGTSSDGESCQVRFVVREMKVVEACRHKSGAWHVPSPSDTKDIEERIRRELFEGCTDISVEGKLLGVEAQLTVRAAKAQTVRMPIVVERDGASVRATGQCDLSLRALGTGKVRVPLGAVKLADRIFVTFEVNFIE